MVEPTGVSPALAITAFQASPVATFTGYRGGEASEKAAVSPIRIIYDISRTVRGTILGVDLGDFAQRETAL